MVRERIAIKMGTCHENRHIGVWELVEVQRSATQIECCAKVSTSKHSIIERNGKLHRCVVVHVRAHANHVVNFLANDFALFIRITRIKNNAFEFVLEVMKQLRKWLRIGGLSLTIQVLKTETTRTIAVSREMHYGWVKIEQGPSKIVNGGGFVAFNCPVLAITRALESVPDISNFRTQTETVLVQWTRSDNQDGGHGK